MCKYTGRPVTRNTILSITWFGSPNTAGRCWVGPVGTRVRELVREICRVNDIEIVKGHVGKDHVHLFVSVPPYLSVSKVMQYLKGKTSHKLLMEFAHLRRQFWGRHLWARGYFAASSGNVTDEMIMQYIATQGQEPSESDEDFKVED